MVTRRTLPRLPSLLLAASLAVLGACVELTTAGAKVDYSLHAEAPAGCRFITEVETGVHSSFFDKSDARNTLRNKTAEYGGNFLVIDELEVIGKDGDTDVYGGSGRAYACETPPPA